jgi:hypothetical protein
MIIYISAKCNPSRNVDTFETRAQAVIAAPGSHASREMNICMQFCPFETDIRITVCLRYIVMNADIHFTVLNNLNIYSLNVGKLG